MKIQDWAKREDLQLQWKKAWEENPVLRNGLEVLKQIALPSETRTPQGADVIQFNALMNARREGYYDAIRNIDALKEIKVQDKELDQPWEDSAKKDSE
jgi:hypothetical protein